MNPRITDYWYAVPDGFRESPEIFTPGVTQQSRNMRKIAGSRYCGGSR